jgi:LysR family cyn operon transcriptional activator
LQDLQAEFGVALFEQVGRRLRLTAEGTRLLPECRALLGQADGLLAEARAMVEGDRGTLRVGLSAHFIANMLPGLLIDFARQYPKVRVQPVEGGGVDFLAWLRRGDLNAAIAVESDPAEFVSFPIPNIYVLLIADRRHGPALRAPMEVRDLAGVPVLALQQGFGTRQTFDAACRLERVAPPIAHESASTETLIALAREGYGVAVVPSTARIDRRGLVIAPAMFRQRALFTPGRFYWSAPHRLPRYAEDVSRMVALHMRRTMFPVDEAEVAPGRAVQC